MKRGRKFIGKKNREKLENAKIEIFIAFVLDFAIFKRERERKSLMTDLLLTHLINLKPNKFGKIPEKERVTA